MTVSERIWSWWGPSRLAHHGDLRSSQWSKPQKLHRPHRKNKSLLWYPFKCVEWKVTSVIGPSFAALSSQAIFMFRWIRLSLIQKTLALNSLFSTLSCEKTRVFLWAIIRLKFTEHFTLRFCIRDLKTSGKSVKFDQPNYFSLQTIAECELWWFLNVGSLTLLTALVLYSQSDYLNHSNRDFDRLIVAYFMRV